MQSLLGQFYNRIQGSQEDIASEGLVYILQKSLRARQAISQIILMNTGLEFANLAYKTQSTGEKLERPDISGIDENGDEVLLIEAKFWASLTTNQPNEYLRRLGDNTVLMFLVPSLRIRTIFEEVLFKIKEEYSNISIDIEHHKIIIDDGRKFVVIKSWHEILNTVKLELVQENNASLISDIDQIIGFCNTIDKNSFLPISDSDLSPSIAKKLCSYYDIIDKTVDEIVNKNSIASVKGLQKTAQKYGYVRYFSIGNIGLGLRLRVDFWSEYADTPFWLLFAEIGQVNGKKKWLVSSEKFKRQLEQLAFEFDCKYLEDSDKRVNLSMKPRLDVSEDLVIAGLVDQIELIYRAIEKTPALVN